MQIEIKRTVAEHYDRWRVLYIGYAEFYRFPYTEQSIATTWQWLNDPAHPVSGFIAFAGEKAVGLAHYRAMPSPLRGAYIGFLDDLYVPPDVRGTGIAEILIDAVKAEGIKQNWPVLRWITRDNNYRARALYDRIARNTDWNTYEISLS